MMGIVIQGCHTVMRDNMGTPSGDVGHPGLSYSQYAPYMDGSIPPPDLVASASTSHMGRHRRAVRSLRLSDMVPVWRQGAERHS